MRAVCVCGSQPSGLNKNNLSDSTVASYPGCGISILLRGIKIKIPQQYFALKMQEGGGLCARGGVFAGHYGSSSSSLIENPFKCVTSRCVQLCGFSCQTLSHSL